MSKKILTGENQMDPSMTLVVTVINLIAKYGVPATLKILSEWKNDNPTIEDFKNLEKQMKDPDSYFE